MGSHCLWPVRLASGGGSVWFGEYVQAGINLVKGRFWTFPRAERPEGTTSRVGLPKSLWTCEYVCSWLGSLNSGC